MIKYFKCNERPVFIEGKEIQVEKFIKINPQLEEIDKKEFDILNEPYFIDEIREKRRLEYPPAGDALDALAKWAFTETEIGLPAELKSWAAKCMAVKSKYPIEK